MAPFQNSYAGLIIVTMSYHLRLFLEFILSKFRLLTTLLNIKDIIWPDLKHGRKARKAEDKFLPYITLKS